MRMRYFLKNLLKKFKLARLARRVRAQFYKVFDLCGEFLFILLRTLHLGSFKNQFDLSAAKKILIIRIDKIGDVILSTAAVRAIRKKFDKAQVHFLVTEYTRDLVSRNTNIDKVLIYRKDRIANDYDIAIALHPGITPNYLTLASGARCRVGYDGWGGSFFLTQCIENDRETRIRHEVDSALEMARTIGCEVKDRGIEISVTEDGEAFAQDFFERNDIKGLTVFIHPLASRPHICWKKERFAEVADRLIIEKKVNVIIGGKNSEKKFIEEIRFLMKEKPFIVLGLSLTKVISIIKRCDLFLGTCSGPMHIASALKVPVVAISGIINPLDSYLEWGPCGEGHIVVSKNLQCPDCHPSDCKTFDCLNLISVEDVLEAANKQMGIKR